MSKFVGYASVFDSPYPVGSFTETVKRGAFKATLARSPDVQLVINHGDGGSGMPIARTGRNMTLAEDSTGLRVNADLDDEDPDVLLLSRKMKAGLLDQMSFMFRATDQSWSADHSQRSILAADIHRGDVSVVNYGASDATSATIRAQMSDAEGRQIAAAIGNRVESRGRIISFGNVAPLSSRRHTESLDLKSRRQHQQLMQLAGADNYYRITRQRQIVTASADSMLADYRARTPLAVLISPTQRQTCPICKGDGRVYGNSRSCSNCGGKGHVIIQPDQNLDEENALGDTNPVAVTTDGTSRAVIATYERRYTTAERQQMAKQGLAMADGSYPIKTSHDLDSALILAKSGHGNNMTAARRHIIARAKALGLSSKIPTNWAADGTLK